MYLVESGPVVDFMLANRIVCLLKVESPRRRVGDAGRKLVIERADCEKEIAKVENIYDNLAMRNINI